MAASPTGFAPFLSLLLFAQPLLPALAAHDYGAVLRMSHLFYEANRSGRLSGDNRIPWRGDAFLTDGQDRGVDLSGGYHDAGDHVKFGFPLAYTVTVLSWGWIAYRQGYSNLGLEGELRGTIKWATDWMLKAHTSDYELWGQAGDGNADHANWGRPEDWTEQRPSYKIDAQHPGSDLAGETAAAFAAASLVFRDVDSSYADTLLSHARTLYSFADQHRGKYSDSIPEAADFYNSWSGYEDELLWSAMWMYAVTREQSYLDDAIGKWDEFGFVNRRPIHFSWDDKQVGAETLLYEFTRDEKYAEKIRQYGNYVKDQATRTPAGFIHLAEWGPARHVINAAYIFTRGVDLGVLGQEYLQEAQRQLDYLLGDNPNGISYVVGFGNNFPQRPHHRAASCPMKSTCGNCACTWEQGNSPNPNPNVIQGALVGGPDENDAFTDARQDWMHTEVGLDYNALLQGVMAAFVSKGM